MTVVADDRIQIGHVDFKNQWDLMIKNVKPEDEGVYVCQVASTNRNIRRMISLTVIDSITEATEISISEEQYVERGEPVALHCNVTGQHYTPDEIDWFRNGEKVTSEKRRGVKLLQRHPKSVPTNKLGIRILKPFDKQSKASVGDTGQPSDTFMFCVLCPRGACPRLTIVQLNGDYEGFVEPVLGGEADGTDADIPDRCPLMS
ncbi:hypothetical protein DPMN_176140 [Dreissena polymorpha]|uniref:Ig-like domain-containing protein n=1 Tax=Dreissena polymorpha TaxID=45954 RepID=A0A9D4E8I8_DREPO|nr:hypothetical protein DPMN_176140 [Dreissena polymorpha]